jgi:RHS repeat-associated protein
VQPLAGGPITGYLYNADGERVAKGTITQMSCDPTVNGFLTVANGNETDYILGLNGEQVTELDEVNGAMTWKHTNIWASGRLLGTWDAQGTHFYLNDWLGNRRFQATFYGTLEQTCQNQPFGDALNCTGSLTAPTEHHFTGKERDQESGNDYFGARYYSSRMGRFLSPDWAAKEEPVPYAKIDDPQTLNLYQYMRNNPLGGVDADGHQVAIPFDVPPPVPAFPSTQLTQDQYNQMGNQVADLWTRKSDF